MDFILVVTHCNPNSPLNEPKRIAIITAAIILGTTLTGCSEDRDEDKRSYSAPHSLCGVAVNSSLLTPFLPPGEHVSTQRTFPVQGTEQCDVIVDRSKLTITAKKKWWPERESVLDIAPASVRRKPYRIVDGKNLLYAGTGAVGRTKNCADPRHSDQRLFTVIQSFTPDRDDADTMKKLIRAYTKEVEESKACRPKRPEPSAS
ncbi:hypothetical protein [Streptomyces flavofungini]|uniref:hypothetical protein n=1 Tax=Streptomyces flavofungini TaxID=68200 RepID=UPI0025B1E099|nr:hypothetical protein [Streptomyces flavofungini]WJV45817.1 hypothetical protein QUY26_09890 [Streptomyces flavofungini]